VYAIQRCTTLQT